jgi:Tol biopolymer transport system component
VGRIAFWGDGIWAIEADGANEIQLTGFGHEPAWSPDGSRITFVRYSPEESERGLWVIDADGFNERRLTEGDDGMATWSPDGSKIAFPRRLGGIYVAEADGSNQTRLAVDGWWPAWSPDGSRIAFLRGSSIYVINTDGSDETLVAPTTSVFGPPAWSPDGSRLAYSIWGVADEEPGVYVVDADGSNRMRLTNGGRVPSWSPDGSRIVSGELYLVAADGSNATQLQPDIPPGGDSQMAVWSPDGSRIAYKCDPEPKYHGMLCVMNADGSDSRVLTENIFYLGTFAWQPKTAASAPLTGATPTPQATETAAQLPRTRPRVTYTGDLMDYVERTQSVPPSPHALEVKQAILEAAGIPEGGAGEITTQQDFEIGYVGGPDVFMVEIRSSDLEGAKMAAEQWLVDQGFTPQDFCGGIALNFYVGVQVRDESGPGTIFFDPVPTACE